MKNILLVGCGKMGSALVDGWTNAGIENISIIEPNLQMIQGYSSLCPYGTLEELPSGYTPSYIIFAVKPQQADKILPLYKDLITDDTAVISIMAGKTVKSISKSIFTPTPSLPPEGGGSSPSLEGRGLGGGCKTSCKIIRVMPNTPALIGQGVSAGFAGEGISAEQKVFCEKLFATVGSFYWVDDENLMDSVTAISGSGPAYVFYFIECLTKAGIELGLPQELAKELAVKTVAGSSALADISKETVQELRKNVTSPNGTTQAGLEILMSGLDDLIKNTAKAAKKRSEELSN
jgi:pyrroline-5-carboxylate reductase